MAASAWSGVTTAWQKSRTVVTPASIASSMPARLPTAMSSGRYRGEAWNRMLRK